MTVVGYRRVDIDDNNIHGYSFYCTEASTDANVVGSISYKDFVSDNLPDVQGDLVNAYKEKIDICVLRNRSGKIVRVL